MHLKGRITSVERTSGGISVTVNGQARDCFHIDNCLVAGILDSEGPDWIGREVEYSDGYMRFLDELDEDLPAPIPFPRPSCSSHHI